jgi:hypothetical protein
MFLYLWLLIVSARGALDLPPKTDRRIMRFFWAWAAASMAIVSHQ